MEWLWVGQITVNFLFLVGMLFWWTDRKSQRVRVMEAQLRGAMAELERRAAMLEAKALEAQRKMDEQFSLISAIGNQAQLLLEKGRTELAQRIPTLEEEELRSLDAMPAALPEEQPLDPTEAPLGLKAVLREQLF